MVVSRNFCPFAHVAKRYIPVVCFGHISRLNCRKRRKLNGREKELSSVEEGLDPSSSVPSLHWRTCPGAVVSRRLLQPERRIGGRRHHLPTRLLHAVTWCALGYPLP